MQKIINNKYVLPAKDFVSSNVAGHITNIFTNFWTPLQESPMIHEQMTKQLIP